MVRLALTQHAARNYAAFDQIQCRISEDFGLAPGEARRHQLMLRDVATSVERAQAPGDWHRTGSTEHGPTLSTTTLR